MSKITDEIKKKQTNKVDGRWKAETKSLAETFDGDIRNLKRTS